MLVKKNLEEQTFVQQVWGFPINETISDMMRIYCADEGLLTDLERNWKALLQEEFIYNDKSEILPIPILTAVNPVNTHKFFVHICL